MWRFESSPGHQRLSKNDRSPRFPGVFEFYPRKLPHKTLHTGSWRVMDPSCSERQSRTGGRGSPVSVIFKRSVIPPSSLMGAGHAGLDRKARIAPLVVDAFFPISRQEAHDGQKQVQRRFQARCGRADHRKKARTGGVQETRGCSVGMRMYRPLVQPLPRNLRQICTPWRSRRTARVWSISDAMRALSQPNATPAVAQIRSHRGGVSRPVIAKGVRRSKMS